jgi:hypothetical protein
MAMDTAGCYLSGEREHHRQGDPGNIQLELIHETG